MNILNIMMLRLLNLLSLESQNSEACELSLNFGYLCSILPCNNFLRQSITGKHFLIFGSNR